MNTPGISENEQRLQAMADAAQDAILMMDPEGRLTFWNPAAERILGYTAGEVLGHNLHRLIAPHRFHAAHHAAFPGFLRTGTGGAVGKTVELQARRKDGVEIAISLSLSAVRLGECWHAVGILRDITAEKKAQAALVAKTVALESANGQLETAVARATEMARAAETANIAKGQFLANMSHEIRTPMNGVIGMTGLLLDTDLSGEQRRYAETIRSSGGALLSVISDILDFSKIEADKLELESIAFDPRETLEETAEILAVRAHDKHLEFICRVDPAVPDRLEGDPGRLRQILLNLGGNAIKFTSAGEVQIAATLASDSSDSVVVRFDVRDTGIGIPHAKLPLLFGAFQQVDASTTRRFGGTGLGLAISKRLAILMGGAVGVESEEGRGSTFWFTARLGRPRHRERREHPNHAVVTGAHILIVDDNATNRLVLGEQLTSWGVRHAAADGAGAALEMLHGALARGDAFDLVICDMQMPDVDGAMLARAIKHDRDLRHTLLVLMTSLGPVGDAGRLAAMGFSAGLTKPVRQSLLYDCLATVIGAAAENAPAPRYESLARRRPITSRPRQERILLAEDNPTNQLVARRVLEKMGFVVATVANGHEAIAALEATPCDLVLMDVQMPEMDGFEATRAIRSPHSNVRNHRVPIIAMTAHAMKGDRERCLDAGMDDYVSKPVEPEELARVIEKWLAPAPAPESELRRSIPVFDRKALVTRLMDDEALVQEVVTCFLEEAPRHMQCLHDSALAEDAAAAGTAAHTLKGAAANVGAMALSTTAADMERAGRAGRVHEVAALMPEIDRQLEELQSCMRGHRV